MNGTEPARAKDLLEFQRRIGYEFSDPALLEEALTHSSYAHERGVPFWNERLEFLGDAVLEVLISEELFRARPDASEGQMTRERASQVREEVLSAWGHSLGLDGLLLLGMGQRGSASENMIGDAVEALIGALYLDGGLEQARAFLNRRPREASREQLDPKSRLQILCQERNGPTPYYELLQRKGPEHDPIFIVRALLDGKELARGRGTSRKAAEQAAARAALKLVGSPKEQS
ncbi:ribonuclease III [Pyramidobacter sp. YE332]|uniref:ribonuclease III n=1 Tax=Pyramidobacter sp. YE332 TaxID=3068894 RepID=UPI00294B345C|nr:ribonuclease III [Pyramidobacter sp. YE332]WOL39125.1 ribonuclease III [Pyramidobacter sp. YE332]